MKRTARLLLLVGLLLPLAWALLASSATATPAGTSDRATSTVKEAHAFLAGHYAEIGVRPNGAFGSTTSAVPTGFHPQGGKGLGFVAIRDTSQTSWSGARSNNLVDGDFFLPGTEYEGWALKVGSSLAHNTHTSNGIGGENSISVSTGGGQQSATWSSSAPFAGISVAKTHAVPDFGQRLDITVTLTNTTASPISNIFYGRGVDPDNDRAASTYVSTNTVVAQHAQDQYALVTASFAGAGQISLFTDDSRAIAARETSGFNTSFDPAAVYSGTGFVISRGTSDTADAGMNLVFKIDSLAPGASTTLQYSYLLSADAVAEATGTPTLQTSGAAEVTATTALLTGEIVSAGGGDAVIAKRGFVIGTSANPVLDGSGVLNLVVAGTDSPFSETATARSPGTTYFARAYATNQTGTGYGSQVSFTTLKLAQSISFNAPEDRDFSPAPFSLAGSATADSGLTPSYGSTTPEVCGVSGTSVTMLKAGLCALTGTQSGNATYDAAQPVVVNFAISKAPQALAWNAPASPMYGDLPTPDIASSSAAGLDPDVSSSTTDVCTAENRTVTIVGAGVCELTATQAGDDRYLPAGPDPIELTVLPRPVSLSGERVYDGTTAVPLELLSLANLVPSEQLMLSGTVAALSPEAGVGTALDVSSLSLADGTGGVATNYTLVGGTHTADLLKRPVRGTFTVASRPYDRTTAIDPSLVTGRSLTSIPDVGASGVVSGDTVTLSGGTATFSSAAADETTSTAVTLTGATLTGTSAANYELDADPTSSATISRRPATITGSFTVAARVFDGTTDAAIATSSLALSGVVTGDTVSLTPVTTFDSETAGVDIPVQLLGSSLAGSSAANYRLDFTGAPTTTAAITRRVLTVDSGAFTVANKVYDGTDTATISGSTLTLTGFAPSDSTADITWSSSARFRVATAGTNHTVELTGGNVLVGPRGANYTLDVTGAPTATATITPRPVTVTGASAAGRPYDGTTAVTVSGASLANTVAGDVVSLATATSGVAASRNAGTQGVSTSMTLSGADAANYRLTGQPSLSITITPLPVSVTTNALPSRAYDGSSALPLSPGAFSVTGVLAGESIAVSGTGQLSSRAAGTRTVTITPTFTPAGGTELVNYTLPTSVNGTVTVTPLPLRVVGASVTSRVWDGSTAATISGATLEGVRAGDAVSLTAASSGAFASAQPGTHAVRFTPTLVGVDATNYTLSVPELTGTITRAPASLRITGGLTQFADGSPRTVRAAVSPAGAGRVVITYGGGAAPTGTGSYPVTVTLDSSTHEASALSATLTVQAVEDLLDVLSPAADPDADPAVDRGTVEERRAAVLARIAVHPDGTRAYPEIGPVLAEDGTTPALTPNDRRVLSDGEPVESRVIVVEDERVRVESDGGFAIELQATIGDGEDRVTLPVDADGTLLLDRGGFVDVGGSGFRPGSTAEVWMFSTVTFLGTAIVEPDGSFAGSFPIDELLEAGEHTIQLNGVGADEQVRSTSLGVRVDDPENSARERIAFASERGEGAGIASGPVWLLLLAALLGAGTTRWWILGRRRRDDEDEDDELVKVTGER